MPNRVVRDAILDSERYAHLSDSAKALFFELILLADDYGCLPVGMYFLRRRSPTCADKSDPAVGALLLALADADLVRFYSSESGAQFAFIPRFGNTPQGLKPKWPVPPPAVDGGYVASMMPRARNALRSAKRHVARDNKSNEINALGELNSVGTVLAQCGNGVGTLETETETEYEKKELPTVVPKKSASRPPPSATPTRPEGVGEQTWTDWLALRRAKRAPVTQTTLNGAAREAERAGMTLEAFLVVWCQRGSQGLSADWLRSSPAARKSDTLLAGNMEAVKRGFFGDKT